MKYIFDQIKLFLVLIVFSSSLIFSQSYFPFNTTNKWYYQDYYFDPVNPIPPTSFYSNITNSIVFAEKDFFRIWPMLGIYEYLRADSIGIYCYIPSENKEWLLYPFNLTIGEYPYGPYITVGPPFYIGGLLDTFKVYKLSENVTVLFGDTVTQYKFYHWGGISDGAHYEIYITKEFGITGLQSADMSARRFVSLLGCLIDSIPYGTFVDVEDELPTVKEYTLAQNYPNPFNPVTTIKFSIKESGFVKLIVYDLLGNEIRTIISERLEPGLYSKQLNVAGLSSGIYIYRLLVNDFLDTKKLIILK